MSIQKTLTREDSSLFFKLWLPLLRYASNALDIHAGQLTAPHGGIVLPKAIDVAEAIWADVSIIDDYLSLRPDIARDERDIILNWKHAVHGDFALERHLQGGSSFISLKDSRVYLVKGLTDSWQEAFGDRPLPVFATVTLLPFKGVIITDGLFRVANAFIGPNIARGLKDIYLAAKHGGNIIKTLP